MDEVYLVGGYVGMYDPIIWNVKVFFNEQDANDLVDKLNNWCKEEKAKGSYNFNPYDCSGQGDKHAHYDVERLPIE